MTAQYRITFTKNGYVAGIYFNESNNEQEAIESAKIYIYRNDWDKVRAELVESSCD